MVYTNFNFFNCSFFRFVWFGQKIFFKQNLGNSPFSFGFIRRRAWILLFLRLATHQCHKRILDPDKNKRIQALSRIKPKLKGLLPKFCLKKIFCPNHTNRKKEQLKKLKLVYTRKKTN